MQTLTESVVDIHPITQKTLDLFIERVKEHEGDNLLKIILFGSVARGEADKYSDIDVLVILKDCHFKNKMDIWGINADVILDMGFNENAYLQAMPMSEESSAGLNYYALMLNVNNEGVVLYDTAQ